MLSLRSSIISFFTSENSKPAPPIGAGRVWKIYDSDPTGYSRWGVGHSAGHAYENLANN